MGIDKDWIVSHGLIERMVLDELKPLLVTDVVFAGIIPASFVEIGLGVTDEDCVEGDTGYGWILFNLHV